MLNLLSVGSSAIVSIVALVLLVAFALVGFSKGFVKTFFSIFGTIISLLLAILLAPSVAKFLQESTSIVTSVAEGIEGFAQNLVGKETLDMTIGAVTESSLQEAGVGGWIISLIISFKGIDGIPLDTTVGDLLGPTFAYYVVIVLAVILLFVIFKIILFVVSKIVKSLYNIKIVATIDRTLGLFLGAINGIVTINLTMLIISIIPINAVQNFYQTLSSSSVLTFISKIDVYGYLLGKISTNNLVEFIKGLFVSV